jgi:hypothetical protein
VLAGKAELTMAARQPGIEDNLGTDLDPLDGFPYRIYDSGAVGSTNVRQSDRYSGHPVEDEEIETVEGGGLQPHSNLARSRLGVRPVTVEQLVGPAMCLEIESLHITSCAATL